MTAWLKLQPSYLFTDKEHRGPFEFSEDLSNLAIGGDTGDDAIPSAQRYQENDKDLLLSTSDKEENGGHTRNGSNSTYSAPPDVNSSLSTLAPSSTSQTTAFAIDDLLGLGVPDAPALPLSPALSLNSKPVLDPGTFQKKWGQLSVSLSQVRQLFVY
jgi:hypothetical protein